MTFTRDTSIADNSMFAGIRSTPSLWCRIVFSIFNFSSFTIFSISVASEYSISSGSEYPKLIVMLPCGSASISNTRFPSFASPIPKFTQDTVLPTPPF